MKTSRSLTAAWIAMLLVAVIARPAGAASAAGTASITDHTTWRGVDKTFEFKITNTSKRSVGSVEITAPAGGWVVSGCPKAPAGWTATSSAAACRFDSAPGKADNLKAHKTSSAFRVSVELGDGDVNKNGTWKLKFDKDDTFNDGRNSRKVKPKRSGALTMHAYVWEILDAAVTATPATIGDPCPLASKTVGAGQTKNVVICGTSHANSSLTPDTTVSTLGGSLIDTPGTFGSGSVTPNATDTVLANYDGTLLSSDVNATDTVISSIGSSSNSTSPRTTLSGFAVVIPDLTAPNTGTVNDGPAPSDIDVQHERTTMFANWSGFSDTGSGIANYDHKISTDAGCTDGTPEALGLATAATDTALALNGDTTYYNCVRATDASGNSSSYVASDGVLVKPLNFNPNVVTLSLLSSSQMADLQNFGDTSCNFTYSSSDSDFDATGPSTLANNATGTVTVSRTSPTGLTKTGVTITAHGGNCGTATLTAND
jgi:hypothetical protein